MHFLRRLDGSWHEPPTVASRCPTQALQAVRSENEGIGMEPYLLDHFISRLLLGLSSIDLIEAGSLMTRPK